MIDQACLRPNTTRGHAFGMSGLKVYCQFTRGISPSNNTGSILDPVLFTIFITSLNEDTEGIIITQTDVRKLGRGLAGSKFRVIFAGWTTKPNMSRWELLEIVISYYFACMCASSLSCVRLCATPGAIALQAPLSMELSRQEYWLLFSHVQLCATPWTAAHQVPPSLGFSRQEYWSGLPFPPPGDLPNPGIEPVSPLPPAMAGEFFTT